MIIRITTENAAFEDGNKAAEVARILKELVKKIEREGEIRDCSLMDINGNKVGTVRD